MENYGFYFNGTYKAHLFTSVYARVQEVGSQDMHPIVQGKIGAIHPVCFPIAVSLWIILNLLAKSMTYDNSSFFPILTLLWNITGWNQWEISLIMNKVLPQGIFLPPIF